MDSLELTVTVGSFHISDLVEFWDYDFDVVSDLTGQVWCDFCSCKKHRAHYPSEKHSCEKNIVESYGLLEKVPR